MAGVPRPGVLANPNGFSVAGPLALPGGVVYGQDTPIIREFLAATSLVGGDAVILAPSLASLGYFVTKAGMTPGAGNNPPPLGVVTGARVGVSAASAASQPVWVVIEGPAWVLNQASTPAAGNLVGLGSIAGQVTSFVNSGGQITRSYAATVSFATSVPSIGAAAWLDVVVTQGAPYSSLDMPVQFIPAVSMQGGIGIGQLLQTASNQWGIRLLNVTSTAFASQASFAGTLITAQASQPVYGQILGTALTSASASGLGIAVFVDPI